MLILSATKLLNTSEWEIEHLNVKQVRMKEQWIHPSFLVDWLVDSIIEKSRTLLKNGC